MSYWGDNLRFFVGKVLNTKSDPEQRGRVQIFIYGIHSDNPADMALRDFPWAEVMLPSTDGGVSGLNPSGGVGILTTASVFGVFLDGAASQLPIVLGVLPKIDSIKSGTPRAQAAIDEGTPEIIQQNNRSGIFTPDDLRTAVENDPSARSKRLALMYFFTKQKYYDPKQKRDVARFTPAQAAGIVGNLQGENGSFDPKLQSDFNTSKRSSLFNEQFGADGLASIGIPENKSKEPSFGIAQWNANVGRFQELFYYAKDRNVPWDDLWVQAEFLCWTLYGDKNRRTGGGSMSNVYDLLQKSSSMVGGINNFNSSTWIFLKKYENPVITQSTVTKREKFAKEAYRDYTNAIAQAS